MHEVQNFISTFIELEQEVRTLDRIKDKKTLFNEKLLEMETFAVPEMKDTFGVIYKDDFFDDDELFEHIPKKNEFQEVSDEIKSFIDKIDYSIQHRILFKIEKYEDGGELYRVYLSVANPQGKRYGECFFIKKINDEFKIVAKYFLGSDDAKHFDWLFGAGDRKIVYEQFSAPIGVKKITTPDNHRISLLEHNKT